MNADTELAEVEFARADLKLEEAESKLKVLQSELEPLRVAKAEAARIKKRLARRRRQGDKSSSLLQHMSDARDDFRSKLGSYLSKLKPTLLAEEAVKALRRHRYYWMRLQHFTKDSKPEQVPETDTISQVAKPPQSPTWERPECEDHAERITLNNLKPRNNRTITLGSFDPGIAKMLQGTRLTLGDVAKRLNIYRLLQGKELLGSIA